LEFFNNRNQLGQILAAPPVADVFDEVARRPAMEQGRVRIAGFRVSHGGSVARRKETINCLTNSAGLQLPLVEALIRTSFSMRAGLRHRRRFCAAVAESASDLSS
jgi:hypothetical protein